ncbi:hypothetical protein [Paenarthrobacter sp. 2TAF44]|uniref:hypothetical protein n=1 Tax=Paenarthrobacter sp. 2TAF44 TaxID=3233018 RepID=UPI003F9D60D6
MITFVKVLHNILFIAGYLSIAVLASVISYYGKPEMGLSIIVIASVLGLTLAVATGIVNLRHKRGVKAAQEAQVVAASAPTTTYSAQATEAFDHDAQTVWALIRTAESAVLLSDAQRAFTVPGTPSGVGEQQCFIGRDGSVSIIEVIGEESPRWATTRPVTRGEMNSRSTYTLEPTPTGCTLTMAIVIELPAGAKMIEDPQKWWESHARPYLNRVNEVLSARKG